jgi:integrase
MSQLPLFSLASEPDIAPHDAPRSDHDSERLLAAFSDARLAEGAHRQSVRREASQLRAVVREARAADPSITLRALVGNLDLIARVLREPQAPISRATGRVRLLAVQRFIGLMGRRLDRDPAQDLTALDILLPARRSTGWHTTGTLVAGAAGRRRRRGPTLDAADLRRIVDAAGSEGGPYVLRDRVLVALHCFTGLRPEEVLRLRWEDIDSELTADGRYGLVAAVVRKGRHAKLLLPAPAADAVGALARAAGGSVESLSGHVFMARGSSGRTLSYRAARDIIRAACRRSGLPSVESASLRAACAHWLRSQGLSDHEVAAVLGLARVRSVDRLLRHHAALNAQHQVSEILGR